MEQKANFQTRPAVIVHGGAGTIENDHASCLLPVLANARDAAWSWVWQGGSAIDAVVKALVILEESDFFDAGFGSYPNSEARVFTDTGLMQGTGEFYSLLNVSRLKRPSVKVLELLKAGESRLSVWTPEMMAEVDSADSAYKKRIGWVCTEQEMVSERAVKYSKRAQARAAKQGTVGCVVRDSSGLLAAGTSTGGTPNKPPGRIGDSPLIGCGVFADNEIGAVSFSGDGEKILQSALPGLLISRLRDLHRRVALDQDVSDGEISCALVEELGELKRKASGLAGAIVLGARAAPVFRFTTPQMAVAYRYTAKSGSVQDYTAVEQGKGPAIML